MNSLMIVKALGVDDYVSFNRETDDGRGLGNQMFNLVAIGVNFYKAARLKPPPHFFQLRFLKTKDKIPSE